MNEKKFFWLEQIRKNKKQGGGWNKERGGGGGCEKKLISRGTSIRTLRVYKLREEKEMRIVKNFIFAKEKVAKVARFSSQHFLPATISAYKV